MCIRDRHNDALNEVVHNRSHVPAKHHVNASDHRHADDAHIVGQREGHAEQARQAIVDAGGIRAVSYTHLAGITVASLMGLFLYSLILLQLAGSLHLGGLHY